LKTAYLKSLFSERNKIKILLRSEWFDMSLHGSKAFYSCNAKQSYQSLIVLAGKLSYTKNCSNNVAIFCDSASA